MKQVRPRKKNLNSSIGNHISAGIFGTVQVYAGEKADADSYEGYFYGASASAGIYGGGIFLDGNLLKEEQKRGWVGLKFGFGGGGSYDAVFYKQREDSPINLKELPGGKCLCYALTSAMP